MNTFRDFTLSDLVGNWTDFSLKMEITVNKNYSYNMLYDNRNYSGTIKLYELEDIDYPDNISRQSRKIEFDGFNKEILFVQTLAINPPNEYIRIYINKTEEIILKKLKD